jgi:hypothetical protein
VLDHADLLAAQRLCIHGGSRARLLTALAGVAEIARQAPDLALEAALALPVEHQPDRLGHTSQRHRPQTALQVAELVPVAGLERRDGAIPRIDEQLRDHPPRELVGGKPGHATQRRVRRHDPTGRHAHESMIEGFQ